MVKILLSSLLFGVGHLICISQDLGWGLKCVNRYEEVVLLPCLAVEGLILGVIYLDDSGWRNKLRNLRRGCSPSVAPINNDVEMHNIGAPTPIAGPQNLSMTHQQEQVSYKIYITGIIKMFAYF